MICRPQPVLRSDSCGPILAHRRSLTLTRYLRHRDQNDTYISREWDVRQTWRRVKLPNLQNQALVRAVGPWPHLHVADVRPDGLRGRNGD